MADGFLGDGCAKLGEFWIEKSIGRCTVSAGTSILQLGNPRTRDGCCRAVEQSKTVKQIVRGCAWW